MFTIQPKHIHGPIFSTYCTFELIDWAINKTDVVQIYFDQLLSDTQLITAFRNLNFMVTWFTNLRNLKELMFFLFCSEKS